MFDLDCKDGRVLINGWTLVYLLSPNSSTTWILQISIGQWRFNSRFKCRSKSGLDV